VESLRPVRIRGAVKAMMPLLAACAAFLAFLCAGSSAHLRAQAAADKTSTTASTKKTTSRHKKTAATQQAAQPAPAATPTPAAPPAPNWPANDKPAAASVVWDSQGLRIEATNSSLSQILKEIATKTGATLEGLGADQRVFGAFGPGPARDVISQLLYGSGYNVLMVGDQGQGTPRRIVLSSPTANGQKNPSGMGGNPQNHEEESEAEEPEPEPPQMQPPVQNGASGMPMRNQQQMMQGPPGMQPGQQPAQPQ
jgi:hypothetical protein